MEYGKWKVKALAQELRNRGLRAAGRKAELVELLTNHDRLCSHSDFCSNATSTPTEPFPPWPSSATFHSIIPETSIPQITGSKIKIYIESSEERCSDEGTSGSYKHGLRLIDDNVDALSTYQTLDRAYFTGSVSAQMRKRTSYNIRFILSAPFGEVIAFECDCPGGRGPRATCKHLVAAFIILVKFNETGSLLIEQACTETLQMFHAPKKRHVGSPVKAECLGNGIMGEYDVDPRRKDPKKKIDVYSKIRSETIQFCSATNMDIANRYAFDKANIQEASLDHSYLEQPFTEY